MYHTRALGSGQKQASRLAHQLRRGLATAPDAADVAHQVIHVHRLQGHCREGHVHQRGIRVLGVVFQGGQADEGLVFHVLLPRVDQTQEPEFERARPAGARPCRESRNGAV